MTMACARLSNSAARRGDPGVPRVGTGEPVGAAIGDSIGAGGEGRLGRRESALPMEAGAAATDAAGLAGDAPIVGRGVSVVESGD